MSNKFTFVHKRYLSYTNGFIGTIGNTPLVKLQNLSKTTGCEIFGKAEFLNPGGSIKDRAALYIIKNAEINGKISKNGTVIEGTAGNTGIGLAHICRSRGYKCIIYMPNTQSPAKMNALKLLGAEVHAVPVAPFNDYNNYNNQAKRHAESLKNSVWTNQFDNIQNRRAHIETTGPEIWFQTDGLVDAFVCSAGTGGSLAGITRSLKELSDNRTLSYLADPPGSVLYSAVNSKGNSLERSPGSSITEGIGQGRITNNLAQDIHLLDGALLIPDNETILMLYNLLDNEGLYLGASSALNVVAAQKLAEKLGPGKRIVTLLCDTAEKYSSRIFSKKWLKEKNLWDVLPPNLQKYAVFD